MHQSCALWSEGVTRNADLQLENVASALVSSANRKCNGCLHYGASVACSFTNCFKFFHFPCAIAAGGFLQTKTLTLVCNLHLDQVPLLCKYTDFSPFYSFQFSYSFSCTLGVLYSENESVVS